MSFDIEQSRREMRAVQQFRDYMWIHCKRGTKDPDGHAGGRFCEKCLGEYLAGIHQELMESKPTCGCVEPDKPKGE